MQKEKITEIITKVNSKYGTHEWVRWREPVGELVRTLLSHNTTDKNSLQAYANLLDKYPTWTAVLEADEKQLAEVIRVAGLAKGKAKKIKNSLAEIKKRQGSIDLEFLKDIPLAEAEEYLLSLNGVGPKTAACILIFSFNFPIMPVDTHVHRLCNRLGIVDTKSREKTQAEVQTLIPDKQKYNFHLNLIEHGRQVCKARNPRCDQCFLTDLCKYYSEQ